MFNKKSSVKKNIRRMPRKVKSKRYVPTTALARRIRALEKVAVPEKKHFLLNNSGASASPVFGQVNYNSNGFFSLDVTPYPSQGSGESNRIGNDIKLTSSWLSLQFIQQSATTGPLNLKVWLFQIIGNPQSTPAGLATVLFNPNPFCNGTIYDYHSSLDPNYMSNVRILATKKIHLGGDFYSGQQQQRTVQFGLKYKKLIDVHFSADGSQSSPSGNVYMYIMADGGNCNATTTSDLSNLTTSAHLTGLRLNYNIVQYYIDQ